MLSPSLICFLGLPILGFPFDQALSKAAILTPSLHYCSAFAFLENIPQHHLDPLFEFSFLSVLCPEGLHFSFIRYFLDRFYISCFQIFWDQPAGAILRWAVFFLSIRISFAFCCVYILSGTFCFHFPFSVQILVGAFNPILQVISIYKKQLPIKSEISDYHIVNAT